MDKLSIANEYLAFANGYLQELIYYIDNPKINHENRLLYKDFKDESKYLEFRRKSLGALKFALETHIHRIENYINSLGDKALIVKSLT